MIIAGKQFKDYTYVFAIVNLTPDSFYAPSRTSSDDVLFRVEKAVKEGAAVIDVGAQSTRPGYKEVSSDEEIKRLEKPLYEIKRNFDIPVSVDTYYSKTAKAALSLGADLINDVWGLTHDSDMAATIAAAGASVCIMHNSKTPLTGDIWQPINDFLQGSVNLALAAGIDRDKICLDGGVGFAKDAAQGRELISHYERLAVQGLPLLLGASRKSLFGGRVEDRLPATLETTRLAAQKKILFVRVHDVKENVQAIEDVYINRKNG